MSCAILITTFNRPIHLENLLISLKLNEKIVNYKIYVYIDKNDKLKHIYEEIIHKNSQLNIDFIFREERFGAIPNVQSAITSLFENYDELIVLEDDLEVAVNFLEFMILSFDVAKHNKTIFSISGYAFPSRLSSKSKYFLSGIFFNWGVGFLKDRFFNPAEYNIKISNLFNYKFLYANHIYGWHIFCLTLEMILLKKEWWDLKFNYYLIQRNNFVLVPSRTFILNKGFDSSGEHCESDSRYANQTISLQELQDFKTFAFERKEFFKDIKSFFYKRKVTITTYVLIGVAALFSLKFALLLLNALKKLNRILKQ
jgi:hypothetical protein